MISSSVRRIALNAPSSLSSCAVTTTSRATIHHTASYRPQRRYSSSKPSSPADGSKRIEGQESANAAPKSNEKKAASKSRKKAKEVVEECTVKGRDEAMQNLPSVPSTGHIKAANIHTSSFWSLHRPISVTSNWPKPVTNEAFNSIFTPRTRSNRADVIAALSDTVSQLEGHQQQGQWSEADELRNAIGGGAPKQVIEVRHLDQQPSNALPFPDHILNNNFQPFHPPPPPVPMNTEESLAAGLEALELTQKPANQQYKTYHTVLTIEESTDENGERSYTAHSSPFMIEEDVLPGQNDIENKDIPASYRERINSRRERYVEKSRVGEKHEIFAISVKRQRKLKMKKHKYKKLMRRTRNLRRRLDRN